MAKKNIKEKILQGGSTTGGAATTTTASKPADPNRPPMLSAANPAPAEMSPSELIHPNTESNWGNPEWPDDTPTINYNQLTNIQNAPVGVSMNDINKASGNTNPKLSEDAKKRGVYAGSQEQVEQAHTLRDIIERQKKNEEDLASLEKRKKRNALFSAIGDGVSALANLYFTTKGSPSADQSKTMSKASQDTYEKERAILERHGDKLLDSKLRVLAQQRAERLNNEQLKIRQQLADAEREYKEAKSRAELKKAEDNMAYLTKKYQLLKEEKEAERKRKDELAKSAITKNNALGSAAKTRAGAYASDVANKNKNRDRDTDNKMANRGRDTETVTETYTDDDGVKRTRTSRRYVRGGKKGYTNTAKTAKKYGL